MGYYNKNAIDWVPSTTSISHSFGGWEVSQQTDSVSGEVLIPDSCPLTASSHVEDILVANRNHRIKRTLCSWKAVWNSACETKVLKIFEHIPSNIWFGIICIIFPIHAKAVVSSVWLIMAHESWLAKVWHYFDVSLMTVFKPQQLPFFCPKSGWAY